MPHLGPLDALRARLQVELSTRPASHALPWGNPRAMTEALHSLQRDLGDDGNLSATDDRLKLSLQKFVQTHQVASFTELKYVCHGVTVPVGKEHWRLVDKHGLLDELLVLVSVYQAQPKQFRRCYQGLLSGYFGFDRFAADAGNSVGNWQRLRSYLNDQLLPICKATKSRGATPDWLQTLYAHKNLLTDDPCSRYAKGLSRGDATELKEVCAGLGIAGASWVWQDALMAYVRVVCAFPDAKFLSELTQLLNLIDGRGEITLPVTLVTQATAMVVIRYCACANQPEHAILRDTCIHWIGNPWINRTAWDAHVNHEPARQMVNGWLKRRLIRDFFELLAQDGSADLRRLNYWLKWEPQITDMWFVLGTNARLNHGAAFMELRKRMAGRDRELTDNNHQNNAFVMRIGQLLVIEFGVTGNACYVFPASDFRTNLDRKCFYLADLKQRSSAKRLSHQSHWEGAFDYELRKLLQSVPMSKGELTVPNSTSIQSLKQQQLQNGSKHINSVHEPIGGLAKILNDAATANHKQQASASLAEIGNARESATKLIFTNLDVVKVKAMCVRNFTEWKDRDGKFWALLTDRDRRPVFAASLDRYGFNYVEGKGFWRKSEDSYMDFNPTPSYLNPLERLKPVDSPLDVGQDDRDNNLLTDADFDHLCHMCEVRGVEIEDNRAKGGALWLLADRSKLRREFLSLLDRHKFRYVEGKGFWLKDKV